MMSSLQLFLNSLLYKTNRFQVTVRLFSNRSQRMSKCGKNISDTLGCALCATFLFLPHFDVLCDLLLNRHTATWNLFVKYIYIYIYNRYIHAYYANLHNVRRGKFQCFVQLLRSNTLFLWWHEDTSSLCLLSDDNSSWQMISNFSLQKRLHLLLALLRMILMKGCAMK